MTTADASYIMKLIIYYLKEIFLSDLRKETELIAAAQSGSDGALKTLTERYSSVIRAISGSYFISGGDSEDLYQIGLIAFCDAVNSFDCDKSSDFSKYVKVCIHRRMIDAVKEANRIKHAPLNTAVDFQTVNASGGTDPERLFIIREQLLNVYAAIDIKLSDYEKTVLNYYIDGLSYREIAARVGKSIKSVDNAISRIRSKLV